MDANAWGPIHRRAYSAQVLADRFPPRIGNGNKRIVQRIASPPGEPHRGTVTFTCWPALPLPPAPPEGPGTRIEIRPGVFPYEPPADGRVDWTLNFAHSELFGFYGGPLFAQDEMQVAEHPALASLREALCAEGIRPRTVSEGGEPTPCLVHGAERRAAVDVAPSETAPYGLYGNRFAAARPEAIEAATHALRPPTVTNVLAMEAPPGGRGPYRPDEIAFILRTAFTGFAAARRETAILVGEGAAVGVHTGFWGCGAYGGDRTLMPLLQFLAADLAGVDRLFFHAVDRLGLPDAERGREIFETLRGRPAAEAIDRIAGMGFRWGVSDGN